MASLKGRIRQNTASTKALDSISLLLDKKGISHEDAITFLQQERLGMPLGILENNSLSALEGVVKYLKEERHLSNHCIALLLGRSDQTIWYTYRSASKKFPGMIVGNGESVPFLIFRGKLSFLESLASYLQKQGYRYRDIARMINRDERTVWTVCSRARLKA